MNNVFVINNPLAKHYLTILRDKSTKPSIFRQYMRKLGFILGYEASKYIDWKNTIVETPLAKSNGLKIDKPILVIGVLGASIPLVQGILDAYPQAGLGLIAARRIETTSGIDVEIYYQRLPDLLDKYNVMIGDPMLATGTTLLKIIDLVIEKRAFKIMVLSVIASRFGIENIRKKYSDIPILVVEIDQELNDRFFIVPGLGDAGDRSLSPEIY
ncbi:MAG: uracil phosphoribosyltransferase [Desulfurococcaceae archaeon]